MTRALVALFLLLSTPALAEVKARAYFIKGAAGQIYSNGLHTLAHKFERMGIKTEVFEYVPLATQARVESRMLSNWRRDRLPIILLGHSRGGVVAVGAATEADIQTVEVDLLITIDPTVVVPPIPCSTLRAANYYTVAPPFVFGFGRIEHGKCSAGTLDNYETKEFHTGIDGSEDVHRRIIAEAVDALTRPGRRVGIRGGVMQRPRRPLRRSGPGRSGQRSATTARDVQIRRALSAVGLALLLAAAFWLSWPMPAGAAPQPGIFGTWTGKKVEEPVARPPARAKKPRARREPARKRPAPPRPSVAPEWQKTPAAPPPKKAPPNWGFLDDPPPAGELPLPDPAPIVAPQTVSVADRFDVFVDEVAPLKKADRLPVSRETSKPDGFPFWLKVGIWLACLVGLGLSAGRYTRGVRSFSQRRSRP